MPVTQDIMRTYRAPRRVVRRLYAMGPREDRAIMWLMVGCFLMFLAGLPGLQRDSVQNGTDFQQATIYAFFALLMLLPLVFYGIAAVLFLLTKLARPAITGYGARIAVFWGWLAATPLALFYGVLVGFNGVDHRGTVLIGALWLAVLLWFWISGLAEVSRAD